MDHNCTKMIDEDEFLREFDALINSALLRHNIILKDEQQNELENHINEAIVEKEKAKLSDSQFIHNSSCKNYYDNYLSNKLKSDNDNFHYNRCRRCCCCYQHNSIITNSSSPVIASTRVEKIQSCLTNKDNCIISSNSIATSNNNKSSTSTNSSSSSSSGICEESSSSSSKKSNNRQINSKANQIEINLDKKHRNNNKYINKQLKAQQNDKENENILKQEKERKRSKKSQHSSRTIYSKDDQHFCAINNRLNEREACSINLNDNFHSNVSVLLETFNHNEQHSNEISLNRTLKSKDNLISTNKCEQDRIANDKKTHLQDQIDQHKYIAKGPNEDDTDLDVSDLTQSTSSIQPNTYRTTTTKRTSNKQFKSNKFKNKFSKSQQQQQQQGSTINTDVPELLTQLLLLNLIKSSKRNECSLLNKRTKSSISARPFELTSFILSSKSTKSSNKKFNHLVSYMVKVIKEFLDSKQFEKIFKPYMSSLYKVKAANKTTRTSKSSMKSSTKSKNSTYEGYDFEANEGDDDVAIDANQSMNAELPRKSESELILESVFDNSKLSQTSSILLDKSEIKSYNELDHDDELNMNQDVDNESLDSSESIENFYSTSTKLNAFFYDEHHLDKKSNSSRLYKNKKRKSNKRPKMLEIPNIEDPLLFIDTLYNQLLEKSLNTTQTTTTTTTMSSSNYNCNCLSVNCNCDSIFLSESMSLYEQPLDLSPSSSSMITSSKSTSEHSTQNSINNNFKQPTENLVTCASDQANEEEHSVLSINTNNFYNNDDFSFINLYSNRTNLSDNSEFNSIDRNCLLSLNKNLIDWNYEEEDEEEKGDPNDDGTFDEEQNSPRFHTNNSGTDIESFSRNKTESNNAKSNDKCLLISSVSNMQNHSINIDEPIKLVDLREFNPLLNSDLNAMNSVFNENLNNIRAKLFSLNSLISILPSNLIYMPRNYLYNSYIYVNKNSLIFKHANESNEIRPKEDQNKFLNSSNQLVVPSVSSSALSSASNILTLLKNRNRLTFLFNSFIRTMKYLIVTKSVFLLPLLLLFLNAKLKQFYLTSSISSSSTLTPTLTTASTATAAVAATASLNSLLNYYYTR
jgi:hypothetical protein